MNKPIKIVTIFAFLASIHVSASDKQPSKNLLPNGKFETPSPAAPERPVFWDLPDGLGVIWEKSKTNSHGKIIKLDTTISEIDMVKQWKLKNIKQWNIPKPAKNPIAATYGLSFYSEAIPVKPQQAYRISFDFKTSKPGEGGKLWIRGYGQYRGEKRRRWETIVFCRVKDTKWHHFSQVFHPTKRRPKVSEMKVMLYAYWPAGQYYFDNLRIVEISEEEYLESK